MLTKLYLKYVLLSPVDRVFFFIFFILGSLILLSLIMLVII